MVGSVRRQRMGRTSVSESVPHISIERDGYFAGAIAVPGVWFKHRLRRLCYGVRWKQNIGNQQFGM